VTSAQPSSVATTGAWSDGCSSLRGSRSIAQARTRGAGVVALCVGAIGEQQEHFDTLQRFGRYPYRNAALGRTSTPEELAYLASRR